MRIGISVNESQSTSDPLAGIRAELDSAASNGFASAWLPHIFDIDALTIIGALSPEFPGLELGTAVVPTYPRHPAALAQQARTIQLLAGGRLTLGIGTSHRRLIETCFGIEFNRPATHMSEYLEILVPLLEGRPAEFDGELLHAHLQLHVPGERVPVLLAAMAPGMLRLAGSRAEGTILWMTGPKAIERHVAPILFGAAAEAGRPRPRIVCLLPVCVTGDPSERREETRIRFDGYQHAPSYKAMLELEGAETAGDIAVIGDARQVTDELLRLEAIGVSDFVAVEIGTAAERRRTREVLRQFSS